MGKISRNAYLIFLSYIIVFYAVPFFVNFIYYREHDSLYRGANKYWYIFVLIPYLFFFFLVDLKFPKIKANLYSVKVFRYFLSNISLNIFLSFIFLVLSILFVYKGHGLNFRHQESISEAEGFIKLFFLLKSYFLAVLTLFYYRSLTIRLNSIAVKVILINILLSLVLTINSSFDIIYIFVVISQLFELKDFYFFQNNRKGSLLKGILRSLIFFVLITLLILVGVVNKIGFEFLTFQNRDWDFLIVIFSNTLLRLSTWYVSLINAMNLYFSGYDTAIGFYGEIKNIGLNFSKLIGLNSGEFSEVWSISRFNYLNIFQENFLPRAGASPGLFASIFYFPFPLLGFLLLFSYNIFLLRRLSDYLSGYSSQLNMFGILMHVFLILPLVDAPLQFINPINPRLLYIIVFFLNLNSKIYDH